MISVKKLKIITIKNFKMMVVIEHWDISASLIDIDNAKNKLLKIYSDKELWELSY